MHRNVLVIVTFLAVSAALVVGVNIGKRVSAPPAVLPALTTTPTGGPTPTPPLLQTLTYDSLVCNVSFDYPDTFIKQETQASASAIFIDPQNTTSMVIFTCQKDIPRPPLPPEKIETIQIASISAKLYHDTNAKDGSPIDKLIFYNPKIRMDVFLAGLGPVFQAALASLKIL